MKRKKQQKKKKGNTQTEKKIRPRHHDWNKANLPCLIDVGGIHAPSAQHYHHQLKGGLGLLVDLSKL